LCCIRACSALEALRNALYKCSTYLLTYLAIVVIIVYIEEVGALIATLCKFAWWNCPKKAGMNGFDKELYVAKVATATVIINYANDVAGVWDRVLQDYQ